MACLPHPVPMPPLLVHHPQGCGARTSLHAIDITLVAMLTIERVTHGREALWIFNDQGD